MARNGRDVPGETSDGGSAEKKRWIPDPTASPFSVPYPEEKVCCESLCCESLSWHLSWKLSDENHFNFLDFLALDILCQADPRLIRQLLASPAHLRIGRFRFTLKEKTESSEWTSSALPHRLTARARSPWRMAAESRRLSSGTCPSVRRPVPCLTFYR